MSQANQKEGKKRSQYSANVALAIVAGQVGCVTIIIVALALIAGLWLDNQFDTKPIFLASLLIASAPVTILLMLWIVRSATSRIKPVDTGKDMSPEDMNRGTN
jgi:hypothetical protein